MAASWQNISATIRDESPVFIVGIPRSGTTALRNTLEQHPSFAAHRAHSLETRIFAEPESVFDVLGSTDDGRRHRLFEYLLQDEAAARALKETVEEIRRGRGPLSRAALASLRRFDRKGRLGLLRWRLAGHDHLVRIFFHFARQARGVARLIEKTPHHRDHLEAMLQTFPTMRVLLCVRHPVDVYSSYRKRLERDRRKGRPEHRLRWMSPTPREFGDKYRRWIERMDRFQGAHPEMATFVRYERLTNDPVQELERICAFIGEPFDADAMLHERSVKRDAFGSPWDGSRIVANEKDWSQFLSEAEAREIETHLAATMDALGYERRGEAPDATGRPTIPTT